MLTVVKNPPRKSGKKRFQFTRPKKECLVVYPRQSRRIKYGVEQNDSSGIEARDHHRDQFPKQEVEVDNQVVAPDELVPLQVGLDKGDFQPFLRRPARCLGYSPPGYINTGDLETPPGQEDAVAPFPAGDIEGLIPRNDCLDQPDLLRQKP